MKNAHTHFQPMKSCIYGWYLLATHFFALLCVVSITPLFLFPVFLLFTLISFSIYFFRAPTILSLRYNKKTEWILILSDNAVERAELLSSSVMMRHFLILHFKTINTDTKRTLLLFSDSLSSRDFQSLRRYIKMGFL